MQSGKQFFNLGLSIVLASLISGCGVTLSPIKRRPLEITPMTTSLAPNPQSILIKFISPLDGVPLSLTVWDNEPSVFVDSVESKQIGFTQDYSKTLPVGANANAGGFAAGLRPDYTRLVVPFGHLFEGVFQSGMQQAFPHVTYGNEIVTNLSLVPHGVDKIVTIKVTDFQVWEKPLNHINLKASVECKIYNPTDLKQPAASFTEQKELDSQSLAFGLVTDATMVKAMNRIVNQFAASISEDVLEQLQKDVQW